MSSIVIKGKSSDGITQISNVFIDDYMPGAHGTFVKVYLILLRFSRHSDTKITVSCIADRLWITENDVIRALKYWQQQGLLNLTINEEGNITELDFVKLKKNKAKVVTETASETASETTSEDVSQKIYDRNYTMSEIAEFSKDENFKFALTIIEKYLGTSLSYDYINLISYMYDELHMSSDFIIYVFEYCVDNMEKKGNKIRPQYIKKVAVAWYENGYKSPKDVEDSRTAYSEKYMPIMKAFGSSEPPKPAQKKHIDAWYDMGFSLEMIILACNKTVLANRVSFSYTNSILKSWAENKTFTPEAVEALDNSHKKGSRGSKTGKGTAKAPKNAFNSYDQREYSEEEMSAIEKLLSQTQTSQ